MHRLTSVGMRFAFYGRVSTEDHQDPAASRSWQIERAQTLVSSASGRIVKEHFDIGVSRSLPWKRRPNASRLLEAIKSRGRLFDAVVIGEPQRAFHGEQFGMTFPVLVHYGVELWVPEIGGPVDPGSDAHDLVMVLYGGLSKGERNRVRLRVRATMAAQTRIEGRYLGGRPPYGYRIADAGPHPNPARAADGRRLHRLEPDPDAAPVVVRIFAECLARRGLSAIARGLTRDGVACPSAHDQARNPHRRGERWQPGAVRAILTNPRYTGRQVWSRQRGDEVLLDVDDVAAGYTTRRRWNHPDDWAWSTDLAHPPLVDPETFTQAQTARRTRGAAGDTGRQPRRSDRPYLFRGLLYCGRCGRRMGAGVHHGHVYYRCVARQLAEPPVDHPPTVYVRQDALTAPVTAFLRQGPPFPADLAGDRLAPALVASEAELRAATARLADTYARCGLHLIYHPDRETVTLTIPNGAAPATPGGRAEVRQAEFVVY
ncbi:recombinase family protein [Asanoa iriomotensis]|uniref:Recombinase n=1 Tax=Asanoa iriomotensis TaxID=234613 RepID=A0ABQ4C1N7_9ACTN|nr:recombinase family protein [Asanoa iriomotensis]GIF56664.1 putative recombinase [Asanoa iriomotensis]